MKMSINWKPSTLCTCVSSLNWNAREVHFLKNNNGTKNYDNNDNDKDNDDDNEDDYDDDNNDDNDNSK